jgi:UDP-N-acetylglucosamine:LPS N-acetylglucosamine transferase
MRQAAHGRRILVVSAAMGGGHTQIARELQRRLSDRGHDVLVVDLLDLMPPPTGRWLHDLYPWLVNRVPWLYQRVYDVFFTARQTAGERAGVPVRLAVPGLRCLVRGFRPDVAVSTYPLSALALARLRGRGELGCPAVTVITTFSVNNLWLHPAADVELCISADAAEDVRRRTGRPGQVCGPIIRPAFEALGPEKRAAHRADVRDRYGIPPESRVALVTTGSMGLAGSAAAAAGTIAGRPGWVPLVVCGRNEELCARMRRIEGAVVVGWVDDMPALMAAADVLVDNNCGMAAKEALGVGLPVVTFRPLAGHGRDDVAAVARLGLTDVVHHPDELVRALDGVVRHERRRRERIARGRSLFVADAAEMIERFAGAPVPEVTEPAA